MGNKDFIAKAETTIKQPIELVWNALIDPDQIKKYMFGTEVTSTWTEGSDITWQGEWENKTYQDKGKILEIVPNSKLVYTHYSPLSGEPDEPENYHIVTIELSERGGNTIVQLSQDNNKTQQAQQHSEKNWKTMLAGMKKILEA